MKNVVLSIRTNTLDDFDIINWEIADLHEIWDEYDYEIDRICEATEGYSDTDSFRTNDDMKLNNIGKYINHYINNSNVAYGWRVNSCTYQCNYLTGNDEYKHKFTVVFDSKELAKNPLKMFGLVGETKAKWLK